MIATGWARDLMNIRICHSTILGIPRVLGLGARMEEPYAYIRSTICHTIPCHSMSCHAMPCHVMPYRTILHYAMLYTIVYQNNVLYHTIILYYTTLSCSIPSSKDASAYRAPSFSKPSGHSLASYTIYYIYIYMYKDPYVFCSAFF